MVCLSLLYRDISSSEPERKRYLERLTEFLEPRAPDVPGALDSARQHFDVNAKKLVFKVYQQVRTYLGAIDTKAGSLMRVNSVLFTLFSAAYAAMRGGQLPTTHLNTSLALFSVLLCAGSFVLLMSCVVTRWETFEITANNFENRLLELIRRRDSRTLRYRLAWLADLFSVFVFMVLLTLNFHSYIWSTKN
jgi:hypothetical protein